MGNTHAVGRKIKVNHPDRVVYSIFSDLRNFVGNLPADMREKVDLKADADTLFVSGGITLRDGVLNLVNRYCYGKYSCCW